MKGLVFKFLDNHLENEIKIKPLDVPLYDWKSNTWYIKKTYYIYSINDDLIFSFHVNKDDSITIWRSEVLCSTLESYFCMDSDDSQKYIGEWFSDTYPNFTFEKFITTSSLVCETSV